MTKRKTGVTFHGSLYHGYAMEDHSRGMRQHRRHKSSHSTTHTMEVTAAASNAKAKSHEAHLIPGVDGHRIFGFPGSIITKLKYVDFYTPSAAAGAVSKQVMSANGLFDPDFTGTGHQPMYFDNWKAMYTNYVVLGSKITVRFTNNQTYNMMVGITGGDDATFSTVGTTLAEQNNTVWTTLDHYGDASATLTMTFEPMQDIGVDVKDDGASLTPVTANPTEGWNYCIWAVALDGSSAGTTQFALEVDYTVKFSQLTDQTQN